ncbi:MAG: ABC transporter ATP-binding protein [Burkholderiaceae bacterium]|jgi:branched-chain amino acid transport system ATP-binding protein|uniref:ABC transporter ATP-binding protein n=1 Tax=Hydrogenophaga sp. TaxID=1904254 RepID=UPI002731A397|nr:ABC transporter ATP-binding protein [Hydrogenophaga sp.]MDP2164894.1 ABC transporter ATP-binding protein [Hydrogenophaga sp.]MDP3425726.1 ABC transporter ATP-binding protein [Burkholderiaceae bacterium]
MGELLHIENLTAGYGAIQVLHGVNLSLASGGRLALIGRNGVGKTTLLKAVMGLADVKAGQVRLDGQDITKWSARERAHAGIGYVPQTRDIFPSLTVEENLLAGLKGRPRSALDEAYALFPRLAERRLNGGQQLSGGEQQMLSVARTLLGKPRLLLLDEPLEGLAPIICIELMRAFEHLAQDTGVAVLLVEQKVDDALRFAPRAMVLERGEVVHESSSAALSQRKDLLERYVGVAGAH